MEQFLEFIRKAKQALSNIGTFKNVHLVLGNESCDLDSTISALSLAYLIHSRNTNDLVIPVMNVEARYFPLRTETNYLLKKYAIDPKNLVYKDQINYSNILKTTKVTTSLVDHHVLSNHDKVLEPTVVEIFDHRTINTEEICRGDHVEKTVIKIVGSCCTLITNEIIESKLPILFHDLSHLLYATIIYDTIGLDKESGKTFEDDLQVAHYLENILKPTETRKELFNVLWKIHNDTSSLTSQDLLYRDLKVVKGVPIPGLPMLVEQYLSREDADSAIAAFASEFKTSSVVLIGIDASGDVKRDIAVFSTDSTFKKTLISILNDSKHDLRLTETSVKSKNIVCFGQGNIKLTRKFILPLVNDAAVQCQK
ncbi:exopolyphosphatase PRUNE1 [Tribolium castaneum]|uniref:Protein prune homolog-like Protein n=1 Tax=Tribolium castaneum TaxID=7070 RepID=D6WGZ0_TRICA|nr:PREDICTED: protein prune homolog [Tribolium castaneum]EFA00136.2 Protein prune homolog-like Protein [Tribolium castaneum]|eukprot:XP_974192.1 PREDICTED: protein prune homolog [Tribolium castaneum]